MIRLRRIGEFFSQQIDHSRYLLMISSYSQLLHNSFNLLYNPKPQSIPKKKLIIDNMIFETAIQSFKQPQEQHSSSSHTAYRRGYEAQMPELLRVHRP